MGQHLGLCRRPASEVAITRGSSAPHYVFVRIFNLDESGLDGPELVRKWSLHRGVHFGVAAREVVIWIAFDSEATQGGPIQIIDASVVVVAYAVLLGSHGKDKTSCSLPHAGAGGLARLCIPRGRRSHREGSRNPWPSRRDGPMDGETEASDDDKDNKRDACDAKVAMLHSEANLRPVTKLDGSNTQFSIGAMPVVSETVIPEHTVVVGFSFAVVVVAVIVRKNSELCVRLFEKPAREFRQERAVKAVIRHHL